MRTHTLSLTELPTHTHVRQASSPPGNAPVAPANVLAGEHGIYLLTELEPSGAQLNTASYLLEDHRAEDTVTAA